MSKEKLFEEKWDKKRIAFGILVLSLFIFGLGFLLSRNFISNLQEVKGAQSSIVPSVTLPPVGADLQNQFSNLQNQVQHLNLPEIASSSPQIQKIIHDLQGLEQYPTNQAKQMCQQVCSGL